MSEKTYYLMKALKKTLLERHVSLGEAIAALESLKFEVLLSQMDKNVFMAEVAKEVRGGR